MAIVNLYEGRSSGLRSSFPYFGTAVEDDLAPRLLTPRDFVYFVEPPTFSRRAIREPEPQYLPDHRPSCNNGSQCSPRRCQSPQYKRDYYGPDSGRHGAERDYKGRQWARHARRLRRAA